MLNLLKSCAICLVAGGSLAACAGTSARGETEARVPTSKPGWTSAGMIGVNDNPTPTRGLVRFVYLVSADREPKPQWIHAIEGAARGLQRFYRDALGGWHFELHVPIVEVIQSEHDAAWFTTNPHGDNRDSWGFYNAKAETMAAFPGANWQAHVWVVYSDGPGNSGRGGGGFAYLPEDDLLGLVGEHPTQRDPRRWVAGGGHELGHALGLPHPPEGVDAPNAIMGGGFYHCWPDRCELTPDDKDTLARSAFFVPSRDSKTRLLDRFWTTDGDFIRVQTADGRVTWRERKFRADFSAEFDELEGDLMSYHLRDPSRELELKLPRAGGPATIRSAGSERWRRLDTVVRAAR